MDNLPGNIQAALNQLKGSKTPVVVELDQLIDYFTDYKYVANMTDMQAKTICQNVVTSLQRIKDFVDHKE